jgi:hypothetical protein
MRLTLKEPRETLTLPSRRASAPLPVLDAEGRKRWQIEGSAVLGPGILGDPPAGVSNGASPAGSETFVERRLCLIA